MIPKHTKFTNERCALVSRVTVLIPVLVAGCVSAPPADAADPSRVPEPRTSVRANSHRLKPAARNIPTPESVIGHVMGEGAVRYEPMVRYLHTLAEASPYVTITSYAESHEGRTLYFLTITSEANHARLAEIKAMGAKLADPRKLDSQAEAERILDTLPGIAWLGYAIHGDELSSTDAAVQVAYELAAGTDEAARRLRDELVIHIDPLMNPDGRERYLSQLQPLTGKVPNPDYQAMQHSGLWSAGRGNHYLFDLNRDWLMQVQPETRGRAARILEWNPHLVVDSHEMGSLDTYLFDPPREPINNYLSETTMNWRRRFSADQAKAFDNRGWSYYTQEWYEEWYPGYTNSWTSLQGAIGLLYEQAGVNAAAIKQRAGNTLTYREAVDHHFVSSLANLETLRTNRRAILSDYLKDRQWAVSAEQSGAEVFLVPPPSDRSLFTRFVDLLGRHGIEMGVSANPFQANTVVDIFGAKSDTKAMPAGTLVVHAAQPRRRLLRALLDFDLHMTDTFLHDERKDLENRRRTRVYDVTAWNLSMAYGLEAYWAGSVPEVPVVPGMAPAMARPDEEPTYGYLIDGQSSDVYRAIVQLLDRECKVRVATEPFSTGGHDYERGTVLLRNNENPGELTQLVTELTTDLEVDIRPAHTALCDAGPDLGGPRFGLLEKPRIAIASQWPIATTSFGSTWFLLDVRTGLRVSPINLQRIGRIDLRKYNVIVLPHAWNTGALSAILDKGVVKKLKSWMESGGTLIAIGSSAAFAAGKDRGLTSVRLRRDVLDQLSVYAEELKREKSARHIQVDPAAVWGTAEPTSNDNGNEAPSNEAKPGPKSTSKADLEKLKREDAWQRLFRPSGVIVAAHLNPQHWLCFGLPSNPAGEDKVPVLLSGQYAFMSKFPVQTPVRLADEEELRLAGLLWPEARKRWANTAFCVVERVGYGQVILFGSDPFFRGYLEGTGRLFLNALLLGPGLGTSQPVPW